MPKNINVGLIGYSFMGKAHSHAYKDMPFFFPEAAGVPVMKAICGRNRTNVKDAAKTFGWDEYETNWKDLIARNDIDMIDISTPGDSHAEIAIAAAEAGKHVFCEKPPALNATELAELLIAHARAPRDVKCSNNRPSPTFSSAASETGEPVACSKRSRVAWRPR